MELGFRVTEGWRTKVPTPATRVRSPWAPTLSVADGDAGDLVGVGQLQLRGNQIVFFVVAQIYFLEQVIFYLFILCDSFLCHNVDGSLL